MDDESESTDSVTTTVELSGEYEQVAEILAMDGTEYPELSVVVEDMGAVMDIVTRTGGATKSQIASELPPGIIADLSVDHVIHVLRVLELYDVVELDGNTWRPGPALSTA